MASLHQYQDKVHYLTQIIGVEKTTMPKAVPVSIEDLRAKLEYVPETGAITWKVAPSKNIQAGTPAGCLKGLRTSAKTGKQTRYIYIRFDHWETPAARVAWALHYGEWPERNVLFKDGDSENLKLDNLEQAKFTTVVYKEDGRRHHKITRDAQRGYGYKRYYGLSLDEYMAMHVAQNGLCAICGQPETTKIHGKVRPLSVDHDHKTNAIRELLCNGCNHMLGEVNDSREILLAAVAYLDKHAGREQAKPNLTVVAGESA